jgi:hypothetical protein
MLVAAAVLACGGMCRSQDDHPAPGRDHANQPRVVENT